MSSSPSAHNLRGASEEKDSQKMDIKTIPMLTDNRTQAYVKFSKVLLVLQDPEWKAKKRYCRELKSIFKQACVVLSDENCNCESDSCRNNCSAWFKNSEEFQLQDVLMACQNGTNLVVVNKFSLKTNDFSYFTYIAHQTKYCLLFEPPFAFTRKGADFSNLEKSLMCQNQVNHLSFGWYLNDTDSALLREEASMYLIDCFNSVPDFRNTYPKLLDTFSIISHYHLDLPQKLQEVLYCMSMICSCDPQDAYYFLKDTPAGRMYGKLDTLNVVGFVVSPSIVAARVNLSYKQREIWEMPDDVPVYFQDSASKNKHGEVRETREITIPTLNSKRSRATLRPLVDVAYNRQRLVKGKGRTAYFTLGQTDTMGAIHPRMDVVEAVNREKNAFNNELGDVNWYDIGKAFAKRFGKYWIVDLKQALAVDTIFASCCFQYE